MIINKQIVLDLLFEHYRTMLTCHELEKHLGNDVAFYGDICLHGSNVIDLVYNIMEIKFDDDNFDFYYEPFRKILYKDHEVTIEIKIEIEEYYNWLCEQKP